MPRQDKKEIIQTFDKLKFGDYSREGLDFEFIEANARLSEIAKVLDEVKDISPPELKGKNDVDQEIHNAINEYNEICQEIKSFNTSDRDLNQKVRQIDQKSRQLYNQIFLNRSDSKYATFPSLALDQKLQKIELTEIEDSVQKIRDLESQANSLVSSIKDSSRSKFAHDYSRIFHNEAVTHSRFSLSKNKNNAITKRWIGYAEWYFLLGLFLIGTLFVMVICNYFIPDQNELANNLKEANAFGFEAVSYTQLLIPFYVKKIIILGILLFGIRFSFKQFSIHKHLHTLNKHRANTLDSFQFFYDNLEEGGAESKEQYLIEVAKSIFSTRETGFIKTDSKEPISLIENLKMFKGQG